MADLGHCTDCKKDCFSYFFGHCILLKPGIHNCPFYKTQQEYNEGLLKYGGFKEDPKYKKGGVYINEQKH